MELKIEPREMFYRISRSCGSSLMRIRLTIARAWHAYRRVARVSSTWILAGDTVPSIAVREFPPRLSCKTFVCFYI